MDREHCSCGRPVGCYYNRYKQLKTQLLTKKIEKSDVHIEFLDLCDEDLGVDEVFKKLGIKKYCCRMSLLGKVNQTEYRNR